MNKVNPEPEDEWWKDSENFPCILIDSFYEFKALVWVHCQIDGMAHDFRDHEYRLTGNTNWRRATKKEIMDNIKGL